MGLLTILSPLKSRSLDEDEAVQKRTFTKWINHHLEMHSSSGLVKDLYADFQDGVLLCHLIEVLTGEAIVISSIVDYN